jgi:hypothetical protein
MSAAWPADICAFGDYFVIVFSRLRRGHGPREKPIDLLLIGAPQDSSQSSLLSQ